MIFDLELLAGLSRLETLNLSDNEIENIDPLNNLLNLKTLLLSNNRISDISPLFDLPKLEYVNISGNKVDAGQIMILCDLGCGSSIRKVYNALLPVKRKRYFGVNFLSIKLFYCQNLSFIMVMSKRAA